MNKYDINKMEADPILQQASVKFGNTTMSTSKAFSILMRNVYSWMTLALVITAFTALYMTKNLALMQTLLGSSFGVWGLIIAQLAVVIVLSARIQKMSFMTAGVLFALYSVLTGVTLSSVFMVFTASSIASTFFITAGTFGAMSAVGYFTKKDLTGMGKFLMMALIGLIIATVVNIFMHSSMLMWITSFVGVLLFVGLTAYDTQKIKQMLMVHGTDLSDGPMKLALLGSLTLYLDFINLFLYLLQFMGRRE